jgi:hypothetical protein
MSNYNIDNVIKAARKLFDACYDAQIEADNRGKDFPEAIEDAMAEFSLAINPRPKYNIEELLQAYREWERNKGYGRDS